MPKTLTVRMDDATYRLVSEAAAAENRSISNFIETAARHRAMEEIFVPEEEMVAIRADRELSRPLKVLQRPASHPLRTLHRTSLSASPRVEPSRSSRRTRRWGKALKRRCP